VTTTARSPYYPPAIVDADEVRILRAIAGHARALLKTDGGPPERTWDATAHRNTRDRLQAALHSLDLLKERS
jgi:hypothetical protein